MKKYIIIAGAPRAGKSTISKLLAKNYGYQHISMDSIIAGIEKTFPETYINSDADTDVEDNVGYISSKIAPFIQTMISSGEYDECDYGVVFDVYQLLPEDYMKHIDRAVCSIYYFVTADISAEGRYEILIENDTPKDYTYYETEAQKRKICRDIVKISGQMRDQCIQYDLPCYEMTIDRPIKIRNAIAEITQAKEGE